MPDRPILILYSSILISLVMNLIIITRKISVSIDPCQANCTSPKSPLFECLDSCALNNSMSHEPQSNSGLILAVGLSISLLTYALISYRDGKANPVLRKTFEGLDDSSDNFYQRLI